MTTMTETRLPEALQGLIDARLDTIDRMLVGRLPRGERLAIVGQVEEQLHEMLAEHSGDDWSRDDVLEILSRLDPPEAYLPESTESGASANAAPGGYRPSSRTAAPGTAGGDSRARLAGILGIVGLAFMLLGVPLIWLIAIALASEVVLFAGLSMLVPAVLATSTIGIVLSTKNRRHGGWAIAGLTLNIVAMALDSIVVFAHMWIPI